MLPRISSTGRPCIIAFLSRRGKSFQCISVTPRKLLPCIGLQHRPPLCRGFMVSLTILGGRAKPVRPPMRHLCWIRCFCCQDLNLIVERLAFWDRSASPDFRELYLRVVPHKNMSRPAMACGNENGNLSGCPMHRSLFLRYLLPDR